MTDRRQQSRFTQQRINGFYNAQCCGLAISYQQRDYGPNRGTNRIFSVGFSLAGLGSFSPISNLGGTP